MEDTQRRSITYYHTENSHLREEKVIRNMYLVNLTTSHSFTSMISDTFPVHLSLSHNPAKPNIVYLRIAPFLKEKKMVPY